MWKKRVEMVVKMLLTCWDTNCVQGACLW